MYIGPQRRSGDVHRSFALRIAAERGAMIGLAHAVDLLEIQVAIDLRCQRAQIAAAVCRHGNVLRDVSHDSASVYVAAVMCMAWALRVVVVSTLVLSLFNRRAET